jgi:hypothetical protein
VWVEKIGYYGSSFVGRSILFVGIVCGVRGVGCYAVRFNEGLYCVYAMCVV